MLMRHFGDVFDSGLFGFRESKQTALIQGNLSFSKVNYIHMYECKSSLSDDAEVKIVLDVFRKARVVEETRP